MQFLSIFSVYFFMSKVQNVQNKGENIPTTISMIQLTHRIIKMKDCKKQSRLICYNQIRNLSINQLSAAEWSTAGCFLWAAAVRISSKHRVKSSFLQLCNAINRKSHQTNKTSGSFHCNSPFIVIKPWVTPVSKRENNGEIINLL